jgi:hypothetical protein
MKTWLMAVSLVTSSLFAGGVFADDAQNAKPEVAKPQPALTEIPTAEKAFVEAINQFDKAKIKELLGEPATADDVKVKGSGKVVASIWHYHNINTDENGVYYETTELDFVNDKVVQVVFINNDGSEANDGAGKKYEMQPMPEMEKLEEIPPTN